MHMGEQLVLGEKGEKHTRSIFGLLFHVLVEYCLKAIQMIQGVA